MKKTFFYVSIVASAYSMSLTGAAFPEMQREAQTFAEYLATVLNYSPIQKYPGSYKKELARLMQGLKKIQNQALTGDLPGARDALSRIMLPEGNVESPLLSITFLTPSGKSSVDLMYMLNRVYMLQNPLEDTPSNEIIHQGNLGLSIADALQEILTGLTKDFVRKHPEFVRALKQAREYALDSNIFDAQTLLTRVYQQESSNRDLLEAKKDGRFFGLFKKRAPIDTSTLIDTAILHAVVKAIYGHYPYPLTRS